MDRESLILKYKKYAEYIANYYIFKKNIPNNLKDDILSISYIGLIKAIDTYDNSKGATLETHIRNKVFFTIKQELRNNYDILSRGIRKKLKILENIEKIFINKNNTKYKETDIIKKYNQLTQSKSKISFKNTKILQSLAICNINKLQNKLIGQAQIENKYINYELYIIINKIINSKLTKNEKYCLEKYFLEEIKMPDISKQLNKTTGGISYLIANAIMKIRKELKRKYHVKSI